jgi:pimeloyl-ACP methyl ester carboxylesterase
MGNDFLEANANSRKPGSAVQLVQTSLGKIAVYSCNRDSLKPPIVFLHGVYFDHRLWEYQVQGIHDRTVVAVDMPLHGASREITKSRWTLHDCAQMLLEILNALQFPVVIAIGHSWGSMTILRAANVQPERFARIGLCNMPLHAASSRRKAAFVFQHMLLVFRVFYTRQVAKVMFGKSTLAQNPALFDHIARPMNVLTNQDIRRIDRVVILEAEDATALVLGLRVPAIALMGEEDYMAVPPAIETVFVGGGHISPLEEPERVLDFVRSLLE